ncbi:phage protein [Yersinia enterocolitica]
MSKNWIRHFELMLLDNEGKGINFTDFKVTFNIEWYNTSFPRAATFKIYNLSQNTINRITGAEFSKLRLIAGYDGSTSPDGQQDEANFGEIFSGDIRYTITGRDNPTDTFILIQAIDGHNAFINATINQTVAAGYTVADINNLLMRNLEPFGITQGIMPEMPPTVFPRGKTMYGMTRDYLDNVAQQCKATWQFVNGKVDMVPNDKYVHEAIVLNSNTGLIGMPQQTIGSGVNVRGLINPNIRLNGLIQLNQESVYRATLSSRDIQMSGGRLDDQNDNGNVTVNGLTNPPASIATDGVYIVRGISYTGDTRGNPWYMDMMCEARGAKDLVTNALRERGL